MSLGPEDLRVSGLGVFRVSGLQGLESMGCSRIRVFTVQSLRAFRLSGLGSLGLKVFESFKPAGFRVFGN